ncbi:hypothetical protein OIV83_002868 [Microbotryomycetes sp. JL201]|nr:hypothetical protein OIV83_002868 [Microbotryomycetes sp. JL201]
MSTLKPRFAQVGGHEATVTLMSDDSSIVNKPATQSELDWYTVTAPELGGILGEWTPEFYGKLTLQGKLAQDDDAPQQQQDSNGDEPTPEMIVLENLTYRFNKPNVLDIKLGTQLYDEHASEEKKQRMAKAAQETTSAQTGVWCSESQHYHITSKSLGKSIKVDQLHDGFLHFFDPPSSPFPPSLASAKSNPETLPGQYYIPVLKAIVKRLDEMVQLLDKLEIRVRGSSLLIVVEGDPETLKSTMERMTNDYMTSNDVTPQITSAQDQKNQRSENNEVDDDDDDDEADSSDIEDEHGNVKPSALIPFDIKWIDFAHARLARGEGPDEGLILGVKTTRQHLQKIIERLEIS